MGLPRVADCCIFRDMRRWVLHRLHTVHYAVQGGAVLAPTGPRRRSRGVGRGLELLLGPGLVFLFLSLPLSIVNVQKSATREIGPGGVLLHDSWFAGPCVKRDRPPAWLHRSSNPSPCPWYTGTRRLARVRTGRGWSQQPTATRTNHDARPGETAEPPKLKQQR